MIRQNNENNNLDNAANQNFTSLTQDDTITIVDNSLTASFVNIEPSYGSLTLPSTLGDNIGLTSNNDAISFNPVSNIGSVDIGLGRLTLPSVSSNDAILTPILGALIPNVQPTLNIITAPGSTIKLSKGSKLDIEADIQLNGTKINQEIINEITRNQEILIKTDDNGNTTVKFEVVLLSNFSAYSCFPKNNYHDHNDYSDNGGEGFGTLIGDSNPMPIEVC